MAAARVSQQWDHTAVLRAEIHNSYQKKKKKPIDFHPFRDGKEEKTGPASFRAFKRQLEKIEGRPL